MYQRTRGDQHACDGRCGCSWAQARLRAGVHRRLGLGLRCGWCGVAKMRERWPWRLVLESMWGGEGRTLPCGARCGPRACGPKRICRSWTALGLPKRKVGPARDPRIGPHRDTLEKDVTDAFHGHRSNALDGVSDKCAAVSD